MLQTSLKNKPWLTYMLILLNILVYILMTFAGGSQNALVLVTFGAKVNSLISFGQWWRLITAMFLHIGLEHLVLNMLTLYFMGIQIEALFGKWRFLVLYLLNGIGGNLASFAFNPSISAGASTALFGLFGAFFMLAENFKHNMYLRTYAKQFLVLIGLNVLFGFMKNADLSGHLGGLVAGFLSAYLLGLPVKATSFLQKILTLVTLVNFYVFLILIGLRN